MQAAGIVVTQVRRDLASAIQAPKRTDTLCGRAACQALHAFDAPPAWYGGEMVALDPEVRNVSDTALFVAHYRALEGTRPDALFHDPLAARLAGERGRRIGESMSKALMGGWSIAIRTVIIDGYITRLLSLGIDTVLNLGAGLDTRPYRMELPAALRWVEVDFPQLIDLKERELAGETPRCRLERVKLDLGDAAARRAFFARSGRRSCSSSPKA